MSPAAAALSAYLTGVLRYVQGHRAETLAVMEILSNDRTDGGALRYRSDDGLRRPILEILRYGQETGVFFPFDSAVMTTLIRSLVDTCSREIAQGRMEHEDDFIEKTVQYIGRMVGERREFSEKDPE